MTKRWVRHTWNALLLSSLLVSGCSTAAKDTQGVNELQPVASSGQASATAAAPAAETGLPAIADIVTYDEDDVYTEWIAQPATAIELHGSHATIDGSGAVAEGSLVTIETAGTYVLSGMLEDGQVVVSSPDEGVVRLVLNGVTLHSSTTAPIYIQKADKAVISLPEGTENHISDAETYIYEDDSTDEPNAAIFSKDDLTINGSGGLSVEGSYNNGITSKDELKIVGGSIEVDAADDGLMGRDLVAVQDGELTVHAGGDAIKTTNDTDTDKGYIALSGGSFTLVSGSDGMQAARAVLIEGGAYDIVAGGGRTAAGLAEDSPSTKGIKGATGIHIAAGDLVIDAADDAIHSNGTIEIADGTMTLASGDDGIHADETIVISGGTIAVTDSYEGIESDSITISGGDIRIVASDDGINAASGSDTAGTAGGNAARGRPGQGGTGSTLVISGGYITVDAGGDGLDANGDIEMSGGTVLIHGPTNNGNGALDYDGTFTMSGGILVAAGSSGMVQAASESSSQPSVVMTFPQAQAAGTLVHLENSAGGSIVTFAPDKTYQSVVISAPELQTGGSYTLYIGGTDSGIETGGLYSGGAYSVGTEVVSFEMKSQVTWLDESGITTARSGGPGMGGGQGMSGAPGERTGLRGEPGDRSRGGMASPDGMRPLSGELPSRESGEVPTAADDGGMQGDRPVQGERVLP